MKRSRWTLTPHLHLSYGHGALTRRGAAVDSHLRPTGIEHNFTKVRLLDGPLTLRRRDTAPAPAPLIRGAGSVPWRRRNLPIVTTEYRPEWPWNDADKRN